MIKYQYFIRADFYADFHKQIQESYASDEKGKNEIITMMKRAYPDCIITIFKNIETK